jgi:hypothetical protein
MNSLLNFVGDVASVPPEEIGHWVWVAGGVGGVCLICVNLWQALSAKEPMPPFHRVFADREETNHRLQQLEARIEAARRESKADLDRLHADLQTGLTDLNRRLHEILVALSNLNSIPRL